ncbi:hypothetical protein XPA_006602 [Xanthoria parietina]
MFDSNSFGLASGFTNACPSSMVLLSINKFLPDFTRRPKGTSAYTFVIKPRVVIAGILKPYIYPATQPIFAPLQFPLCSAPISEFLSERNLASSRSIIVALSDDQ